MLEKERRPEFARMLAMNITGQIFQYLKYKVQMRENINIAFKGETRSGKSTAAISVAVYISKFTGKPFDVETNVCANESEYYKKVQHAEFNSVYQIDEQKEIGY